jgi:hypothetical protein
VSWNVDPLALRVPERAALLGEDEPPEDPLPPEDPQAAASEAIAAAAIPTVVMRWMRRRCMSKDPILRYSPVDSSGARSTEAPHGQLSQPD